MSGSDSLRIVGDSSFGRICLPPLASVEAFPPFRLRPASVSGFPLSWLNNRLPCGSWFLNSVSAVEFAGSPKFLTPSLHAYHALRWTPADPRKPHQIGSSAWASDTVNTVAIRFKRHDGAVSSFGDRGLSCGLHASLCTLQLTCSVFTSAVAVATLGRSGWLILTPQGLSPCKKAPSFAWRTNGLAMSRKRREHYLSFRPNRQAPIGGSIAVLN